MTKLYFDHTDAVFLSFLFYYYYYYFILLLVKIFQWFSDYPPWPPDENSWIRTGTLNEYMSI